MFVALCRRLRPARAFAGLTAAAFALLLSVRSADADGWTLVFNDDFGQASLDTTTWFTRYIYNNGTMDHFNDEKQRFREDGNHVLQGGVLSLVAKGPNAAGLYTSGMIRSRKTFRYGYFEARIKLPPGRGMFPAFWLNSDYDENGKLSWPPEIDIMEAPGHETTTFSAGTHWTEGSPAVAMTSLCKIPSPGFGAGFHTYGILWQPDRIVYYYDRLAVAQIATKPGQDKPFYMMVNMAVGGDWQGFATPGTVFPQKMKIDWVAAYTVAGPAGCAKEARGVLLCK